MLGQILSSAGMIAAPARVLVAVAHPDDVDFGSAGTVAQLTALGSHVAYCLVTSGDAGDDNTSMSRPELAELREAEQTAAAAVLGVSQLYFLRHPDGMVEATLDLRRDIARVIRRERPEVVITQSPERNWESVYASHPDHMATGQATMAAVYPDARNPRAFPELLSEDLTPHKVSEVWVATRQPDFCIDITDSFDKKLAALRAHRSQTAHREDLEEMLRGWGARIAAAGDMPEGRLAEGFRRVATA